MYTTNEAIPRRRGPLTWTLVNDERRELVKSLLAHAVDMAYTAERS